MGFQLWVFLLRGGDLFPHLGKPFAGVFIQRDWHKGKVGSHKRIDACHVNIRRAVHNNKVKRAFVFRKVAAQALIPPTGGIGVCDGVDLILRQSHVRAQPFPRRVGVFHFGGNLLVYSLHAFLF